MTAPVLCAKNKTGGAAVFQEDARPGNALVDMLDAIKAAKAEGASEAQLAAILETQRKAQWRLDFVAAENSMGFHAAQELARILAESIDLSRQAQLAATSLKMTLAQAAH